MGNDVKNENLREGLTVRDVFAIIKRYFIFILASIIIFTGVGFILGSTEKPDYTVSQKILYRCKNIPYVNSDGKEVNTNNTISNINTMMAYGETIIDLFDEGVVLDRANYYYKQYVNAKKDYGELLTAEAYVEVLKMIPDNYKAPTEDDEKLNYIVKSAVGTSEIVDEDEESTFAFRVSYTADGQVEATDKLTLLVYAFEKECLETKKVLINGVEEDKIKYFGEFEVTVSNHGVDGVRVNSSKKKTIIIFFVAGVALATITVILLSVLDNTIKSKEELERITGVPVIAAVNSSGV